MLSIEDMN